LSKKFSALLLSLLFILSILAGGLSKPGYSGQAAAAVSSYTFAGRRGGSYTASWDKNSYQVTIASMDKTFPWDWISFVGRRGAVSLAGHQNVAATLAFSEASALNDLQAGDLMRVKAWDNISLAHLTKIGLVIGEGPQAGRAWLGDGTILEYYLAPEFIGYRVQVLNRTVTVHLSHIQFSSQAVAGVIKVMIDNPQDARFYFVSDLEPAAEYRQAVEYRTSSSTLLAFDGLKQAITASGPGGVTAYMYASSDLLTWSANNLAFSTYLAADQLDEAVSPALGDGRSALVTAAQPEQYFYIGNQVLPDSTRQNPEPSMAALREERLTTLHNLPLVSAVNIPGFEFVTFLSNLFLSYLVNPEGNIFYTDKVFPYTADNLMILTEAPEILPASLLNHYRDYLDKLGDWQYTSPTQGAYWWRADVSGLQPLPAWYAGNIPDIIFRDYNDSSPTRRQYSDIFATAEYLTSLANYHRVTGDSAFLSGQEAHIRSAYQALLTYNTAYYEEFPSVPRTHHFPHLQVPMGDLYLIPGVYPAESGMVIYALEDAVYLLGLFGDYTAAQSLNNDWINPMRQDFNSFFWDAGRKFFLPRRDQRSNPSEGQYIDFWSHTLYPSLKGDLGREHLAEMLETYLSPAFYDLDKNYRWLNTDSENYMPDSYFSPEGYVMEGGFFNGATNIAPVIASYQLGLPALADEQLKDFYTDVWLRMGPYETMREWDSSLPGRYLESSIYIEPLVSTLWAVKEMMGITSEGITITVEPGLGGEFLVTNLNLAAGGKRAVIEYQRDVYGCETLRVLSNTGLNIHAPNVGSCGLIPPAPTPTPLPEPPAGEYRLYLSLIVR
jgi:hypothetical protein